MKLVWSDGWKLEYNGWEVGDFIYQKWKFVNFKNVSKDKTRV